MKILQLIDSLQLGGAERMCVNITNVLHDNGDEITLCATREGGPLEKYILPGVDFYILKKKRSVDIAAFSRLMHIIRNNGIEVIHAHSNSLFWAVAVKICVNNLKVVWHDHSGIRIKDKQKNIFYRLLSRKIDAIISVNKELAAWSHKYMNVSQEKIVMINNFSMLKTEQKKLDPGKFTIICLANLRPQKDQETLVKAIALLVRNDIRPKLRVLFVGSNETTDFSLKIRRLISKLGLENIIELTGSVGDTASILAQSNSGVLSSISEGLPVALLEYGLAALPVVVTNVGQCAEVVGNGRFGRVVPPSDPEAMANELLWIINNSFSAFQMGFAFREHVITEYGPAQFMRKYHNLLKRIYEE